MIIKNNGYFDIDHEVALFLQDKLILSCGEDTESEKRIVNIYFKVLELHKKIPTFQTVLDGVIMHNWHAYQEGAVKKYEYIYKTKEPMEPDDIYEMTTDLEDDYNMTENVNLEYYVGHILSVNRLACEIEIQDNIFHEEGMIAVRHIRDVKIIAQDCQNLLIPNFVTHGVAGYGDFTNYYNPTNNENILLLGSGGF